MWHTCNTCPFVVLGSDNGPNTMRYVGNMRGMKTGVDDGGIRPPLLFHWPAKVSANRTVNQLCAHIDITPTILDACDVNVPAEQHLDGRSFLPLLTGDRSDTPRLSPPTRATVGRGLVRLLVVGGIGRRHLRSRSLVCIAAAIGNRDDHRRQRHDAARHSGWKATW